MKKSVISLLMGATMGQTMYLHPKGEDLTTFYDEYPNIMMYMDDANSDYEAWPPVIAYTLNIEVADGETYQCQAIADFNDNFDILGFSLSENGGGCPFDGSYSEAQMTEDYETFI
jgi:hypothetical protein